MKTIVTLLIQRPIESSDDDAYEAERDEMIEKLQESGWTVTIEDETEDDDITDYDT